MDFLALPRRDLQALCKRNGIRANMTNVAMAEALAALPTVRMASPACPSRHARRSLDLGAVIYLLAYASRNSVAGRRDRRVRQADGRRD